MTGNEQDRACVDWKSPGTLHLTVSMLADHKCLDKVLSSDRWDQIRRKIQDEQSTDPIAPATNSMFHDIADRERQVFFAEALRNADNTEHLDLTLTLPHLVGWSTEGIDLTADFESDLKWTVEQCRHFWFLHSNDSLSYHVSFQIKYQHRLQDYYALSVLQKVFFPAAEQVTPNLFKVQARYTSDEMGLMEYLGKRFNEHAAELFKNVDGSPFTGTGAGPVNWYDALLLRSSVEHAAELFKNEDGSPITGTGTGPVNWYDALPLRSSVEGTKKESSVPIDGSPSYHCRAAFLFKDELFFNTLWYRDAHLKRLTKKYLASMQAKPRATLHEKDQERIDPLKSLAGLRWSEPETEINYSLEQLEAVDQPCVKAEVALIFLSGLFENLIDFLRQDDSEVEDGTDRSYPGPLPTYPVGEEPHFLLYVTQDAVFEVVPRSGSLDRGSNYIGTCPYLFLVHVTAFHDEELVKRFERDFKDLVDKVETYTEHFSKLRRMNLKETADVVEIFHKQRLDIFTNVDKYLHLNVFRYDTEEAFYNSIVEVRGIHERQLHWERVMSKLSETIDGMHALTQQKAAEQQHKAAEQQRQIDSRLTAFVALFTLVNFFLVLFAITTSLREIDDRMWAELAWHLDHQFIGATIVGIFLVMPIVGILSWRWWKNSVGLPTLVHNIVERLDRPISRLICREPKSGK